MTELLFKIIIIGDPTVGKTSFIQRYVNDSYRRDYKMTIGGKFKGQASFSLPSKITNIHIYIFSIKKNSILVHMAF